MNMLNHNGAVLGRIEKDSTGYVEFFPRDDWHNGYSAYQLEQIAKVMRLNENGK